MVCCMLFVFCGLLRGACCVLVVGCLLKCVVRFWSSFIVRWLLMGGWWLVFVVCCGFWRLLLCFCAGVVVWCL